MGLVVTWRFLVSRLVIGVAVEVEVSRFLDRRSSGVVRLLRFYGGAVWWVL